MDPEHPQIILPWKYLDEVKSAPQNRLSFPFFSKQVKTGPELQSVDVIQTNIP